MQKLERCFGYNLSSDNNGKAFDEIISSESQYLHSRTFPMIGSVEIR